MYTLIYLIYNRLFFLYTHINYHNNNKTKNEKLKKCQRALLQKYMLSRFARTRRARPFSRERQARCSATPCVQAENTPRPRLTTVQFRAGIHCIAHRMNIREQHAEAKEKSNEIGRARTATKPHGPTLWLGILEAIRPMSVKPRKPKPTLL